jgi:hypothetical protein
MQRKERKWKKWVDQVEDRVEAAVEVAVVDRGRDEWAALKPLDPEAIVSVQIAEIK